MTDHSRCPECEGRGVHGPRFPEMWERAEDFICRRCDGTGYIVASPSEWTEIDVPELEPRTPEHEIRR